jgi:ABC-type proline/glycine betaine transport system permease subunit
MCSSSSGWAACSGEDLGESLFIIHWPVTGVLADALGPTASLAILAELLALVIAVPAGIMAARRRGTAADRTFMTGALPDLGVEVPARSVLVLLFAVGLGWFPVAGFSPIEDGLVEHLTYLVLPAVALGAMQAALIARTTGPSMLDVLTRNFMKTAKAKGLSDRARIYKHALKNEAIPVLTVIGQTFGILTAGAAVVGTVFNIPGNGQLVVNSVERRDFGHSGSRSPDRRQLRTHQPRGRAVLQRTRSTDPSRLEGARMVTSTPGSTFRRTNGGSDRSLILRRFSSNRTALTGGILVALMPCWRSPVRSWCRSTRWR